MAAKLRMRPEPRMPARIPLPVRTACSTASPSAIIREPSDGRPMARIRIQDIAAEAGVSPATVSRVLNDRPGTMREQTRKRVLEVIERTGYRPSNAARSLRTDRTNTVGVILADIRNPFSGAMLEALSARGAERGLSLMTSTSGNDPQREAEAIERLVAAGVDGLIVNTCGADASTLNAAAAHLPVVLLDRELPGSDLPLVTSNNAELMAALVDELAGAGCRRCHLLDERSKTSAVRRIRARAFMAELARLGLDGTVIELDGDPARAAAQLNELADGRQTSCPLGLVTVNGLVFLRLVEALGATELRAPAGVRLATFDDYAWNHVLFGGVTTAVQDTGAIAGKTLEWLLAGINEPQVRGSDKASSSPRRAEVPGRVIRRASTRAAGAVAGGARPSAGPAPSHGSPR